MEGAEQVLRGEVDRREGGRLPDREAESPFPEQRDSVTDEVVLIAIAGADADALADEQRRAVAEVADERAARRDRLREDRRQPPHRRRLRRERARAVVVIVA